MAERPLPTRDLRPGDTLFALLQVRNERVEPVLAVNQAGQITVWRDIAPAGPDSDRT